MSDFAISALLPGGGGSAAVPANGGKSGSGGAGKAKDAAQQFEALLIGQILRSVRESGTGWLGSGEDASGECATDYAEQQFASVMAKQGGLGLAEMISRGLTKSE